MVTMGSTMEPTMQNITLTTRPPILPLTTETLSNTLFNTEPDPPCPTMLWHTAPLHSDSPSADSLVPLVESPPNSVVPSPLVPGSRTLV